MTMRLFLWLGPQPRQQENTIDLENVKRCEIQEGCR